MNTFKINIWMNKKVENTVIDIDTLILIKLTFVKIQILVYQTFIKSCHQ